MNDEVRKVVGVLRHVASQVSSPIIRDCLEEAWTDILYLAGEDEEESPMADQPEAA